MKNQWYYKNSVLKYRFYEKHSFREKKKSLIRNMKQSLNVIKKRLVEEI